MTVFHDINAITADVEWSVIKSTTLTCHKQTLQRYYKRSN